MAPDISADGRYVTFVSAAFLTADDTNTLPASRRDIAGPSCPDAFRHDRITGSTVRVSVASNGAPGRRTPAPRRGSAATGR